MATKTRNTHRDLEFAVDGYDGKQRTFRTFRDACAFAVERAASRGETVHVDVLAWSVNAARFWAGDEGADRYCEDPDASVFERIKVTADCIGSVA